LQVRRPAGLRIGHDHTPGDADRGQADKYAHGWALPEGTTGNAYEYQGNGQTDNP
jgi:hypothetical protein